MRVGVVKTFVRGVLFVFFRFSCLAAVVSVANGYAAEAEHSCRVQLQRNRSI